MKATLKTRRTFAVWLLLLFGFTAAQTPPDLAGRWSGAIKIPDSPLEIVITLTAEGALGGTIGIPAYYLQTELALGVAPGGTRVVSEENLRTTWEPQVPVSANTDYGLGWFVGDYRGLRLVYHGGNTLGFTSDLAFLPGKDLGVVVLTNAQATNAFNEAVRERLLELVFDQPARVGETVAFAAEQMSTGLEELDGKLRRTDGAAVQSFAER